MNNLVECENIYELYLTGNPCLNWENCVEYIMAKVPQMKKIDGTEITKSQRITATQKLDQLEKELRILA